MSAMCGTRVKRPALLVCTGEVEGSIESNKSEHEYRQDLETDDIVYRARRFLNTTLGEFANAPREVRYLELENSYGEVTLDNEYPTFMLRDLAVKRRGEFMEVVTEPVEIRGNWTGYGGYSIPSYQRNTITRLGSSKYRTAPTETRVCQAQGTFCRETGSEMFEAEQLIDALTIRIDKRVNDVAMNKLLRDGIVRTGINGGGSIDGISIGLDREFK
jgi:hypothetical protein